jgi:hypothetical protein
MNITLSPLSDPITFNSTQATKLDLSASAYIKISENAFKKQNGDTYNGQVNIYKKKASGLKVAPINSANGGQKALESGEIYQVEAYGDDDSTLTLQKPIELVVGRNLGKFSYIFKENRFKELKNNSLIEEIGIIGFGVIAKATKVEGEFKTKDNLALPFENIDLMSNQEVIRVNKTQSG